MDGWTVLIAAHAAGATLALLLGGYVVVRRRKGDRLHRRLGALWLATAYWVAFSSFGIQRLHPGHFTWIHILSAWTIVSLSMALWAAATHRVRMHRDYIVGSYLGLVGAGVAAVAFPQRLVPQTALHHPLVFVAGVAAMAVLAVVIIGALAASSPRQFNRSDGRSRNATGSSITSSASPDPWVTRSKASSRSR